MKGQAAVHVSPQGPQNLRASEERPEAKSFRTSACILEPSNTPRNLEFTVLEVTLRDVKASKAPDMRKARHELSRQSLSQPSAAAPGDRATFGW